MTNLKIQNSKLKITALFFGLLILFANRKPVFGQTVSLSIWPPSLEVQMMPGKMVTQNYKLGNNSDFDLEITPLLATFEPKGINGEIKLLQYDPSPYFFSFTSGEIFNQSFILKSKETKNLSLKIVLPKNNPEKDYYFTLLFSSNYQPLQGSSQTASVSQIGTHILLTASSVEKPPLLARIYLFTCPQIIDSFSKVKFDLILENYGASYFKPFGQIDINGFLNQKEEIKLVGQNTLSRSKRQIVIEEYQPKLPLGKFKAKLEFSLNEEGIPPLFSQEISFWYLPYKLFALLVFFFFLLIAVKKITKKKPI